jgi:hypothetical protein
VKRKKMKLMEDDELMENEGETDERNGSKTAGSRRQYSFKYFFL